jgi:hypothetical protein
MEKDLLILQDQAGGMDDVAVNKWVALEEKRGPLGHSKVICLSKLHV